ncbi:DNA polymerase III subunit gamma/tau [Occallatibacter savannae]|uniref:DNA polymerase III subunit gamma/tau n=1 Tax=Occallatibacter savannae TaxID=1002691 RepID=UPI000D69B84C|nr:DNA polymerase III subunit gamma/tau [Occallatibacter savannae]
MGYQVLARKYRPQRFADVAGQDHVTRTLLNALTQNRIAHGYIFSGHRGIGKTTIARILAMALNCRSEVGTADRPTHEPCLKCVSCREISSGGNADGGELATHSFDFIEIDAASNRGIDDVRSIRTQASVQPARDKYKIFLLDEAHQITDAAFNAILKTLEEPPEWTIFMMATTEPENIPQTIRSRCQHFSFHAVKFDDILGQLKMIAQQESVRAEDAALALLAEAGDGSMRDALSIMDQAIASAPCDANNYAVLEAQQIRDLMGSVPNTVFEHLLEAVAAGNSAGVMGQLNELLSAGHSPQSLARQIVRYLRNTLMAKLGGEQTELLQISGDERARAARTALLFTEEEITRNLQLMLRTFDDLNYRQEQRFHLELGLMKLVHARRLLPLEELLSGVASGAPVRSGGSAAPAAPRTPPPSAPRSTPAGPRSSSSAVSSSAPPPPRSPFGSGPLMQTTPIPESLGVSGSAALAAQPAPVEPAGEVIPFPSVAAKPEIKLEPAPVPAPPVPEIKSEPAPINTPAAIPPAPAIVAESPDPVAPLRPAGALDAEAAKHAIVTALAQQGHASASQLISTARFTLEATSLRIEVPGIKTKMLSLTVNAAAEKIIKQEVQRLGGPSRFMVIPGEGVAATTPVAAPAAGSIQQAAMEHPMVQRAKEIFNAEVRSVVDLRNK